ncbi:carbonic anhydrase 4-like isoform X1 [Salvelinus fontinalis]|uniref:carbonic anhydrase 4-like isoform X1 n=1 Tax=Salvelinus fontinalis TaxID=8038 RepID=UPI0024852EA4|nr:carbonic anhydrase 4-like isoform X1 [Salvelinus fontinalis]
MRETCVLAATRRSTSSNNKLRRNGKSLQTFSGKNTRELRSHTDWCYQSQHTCDTPCNGPEKWEHVNRVCAGENQSPINIVHRKTVPDKRLTPFQFKQYQDSFQGSIKNNGHSVQVSVPHDAYVIGGDLEMPYKAVQFHLHWGKKGGPGSEHTIDGEQYPMELHIVHMKQQHSNLGDALKDPSGVAVLGFFYEESLSENRKYDPIVKALQSIRTTHAQATLSAVSLEQLIPPQQNLTNYYRYKGSLTTPNCTESVVWTVFEKPIPLSKNQLLKFSELQFKDGKDMVDTFRPVQPLNRRVVYRSGGAVVLASVALLVASVAMATGLSQPN